MALMDWNAFAADLATVHAENSVSIAIRRQGNMLSVQTVRIARLSSRGQRRRTEGNEEVQADVLVAGAPTLDIQVDDRFTVNGVLYQVVFVRPNRRSVTQAEAKVIE